MPSAMLSAVLEEEPELYEAFPPHVDTSGITVLTESPPERKTPKEILKTWYQFFRNLRLRIRNGLAYFNKDESCEDDPRPGRPVTVVTEENVRKIEKLVLADRRIKLWQIAEELQINKERVGEIVHEHMNMRKISARWVPTLGSLEGDYIEK
ncbi:Putative uncharacterized protein FLJ37770 [Eumeta japonica]|uniref:Mariner Mos1 transposase n=1 Tax=Eumeta variegata TaxID=151549 RepID=A0A4C1V072_EUMVA|nr:Putative uncharacterized protein FLJ37770 [Eumeta japonica]